MGSGMPEIGSRISLISKADIRYEGKLFSVDPDECTIALSSVRSYGTEDRKTTYPVPAQHQVYDFILFRGSDIKDIRVLTTTIPNDPAIVQLSVPPSLSAIENQFETADSDFRVANAAGAGNRVPGGAPGSSSRPSQTFQNSGFKSTSVFTNLDQVMKQSAPNAASEDGGSRSSTPSALNAKNAEAPARTSISSNKSDDQTQQQQRKVPMYRDMNRSQPQYQNRYQNQQQGNRPQYQQRYQQNRYPQQQQQQQQRYPQQSQYRDYNNGGGGRDFNGGGRDYNSGGGRDNQQYRNYNNDYRGDGYGQRQYMQPLRGNVQRTDNWINYNQRRMNRPPGQAGNQNNYQSGGGYQNQNRRPPRNTLKFDEEYDFEQANSQFEEVRLQMSKVKIDDPADPAAAAKVNGDADKKEDSGNEVSGGEENDHEAESQKEQCYDKVKSFFDNISYEAIERSKGLTARLDWKTERKINSETFGQVALRRNLNNYRRRMNNNNNAGGGGQNGGNNGYYNNYQQNRNQGMQNNYRTGGYQNRLQQGNRPRRQYNQPAGDHEESKENQVAA